MRILLLFSILQFISISVFAQYHSHNGASFSPKGQFRFLNIFVNIHYDQTPQKNPLNDSTEYWMPGATDTINANPPANMTMLMDVEFSGQPEGNISRYFYESSFGTLQLTGDFMVINILQSEITPDVSGKSFSARTLSNAVIRKINKLNGWKSVYGHDSIAEYDRLTPTKYGMQNKYIPNDKIDYIQIHVRNATKKYGQTSNGHGFGNIYPTEKLKIGEKLYGYDDGSIQGIGADNIAQFTKLVAIHEFAHTLLGSNAFHEGGGNHYNTGGLIITFMGLQSGYGILGGANSSLVSCNGFDRWRLNWKQPADNPFGFWATDKERQIVSSDVVQSTEKQTFYLRDFITYGDVVRIRLPYKDTDKASNQYLWLENHQIGKNDKLDFLHLSNTNDERPVGTPGIYAYIQVGKDTKSGSYGEVFPSNETDNLRFITAEGFWDMCLDDTCQNTYLHPNAFMGAHDLASVYKIPEDVTVINPRKYSKVIWFKKINGKNGESMPFLGDSKDAFTNGDVINLSTNPAAVNTVTYYVRQQRGNVRLADQERNMRQIHLTGLGIEITESGENEAGKIYGVDVSWNNYVVEKDVHWTGNIVLHEKIIVDNDRRITIDQNYTPAQVNRDSTTGYFAPVSQFRCLENTSIHLQTNSAFELKNGSMIFFENASQIVVEHNATLKIDSGCKLFLAANAKIIIRGSGRLVIENGARVTVSPQSTIELMDKKSRFMIEYGVIINEKENSIKSIKNNVTGKGKLVRI